MKNISNNYNKYIFGAYPEPFVPPSSLLFPSTVFLFVSIFFCVCFALRQNEGEGSFTRPKRGKNWKKGSLLFFFAENGKFKLNWFVAVVTLQFCPSSLAALACFCTLQASPSSSVFPHILWLCTVFTAFPACCFLFFLLLFVKWKINAYFNSLFMWNVIGANSNDLNWRPININHTQRCQRLFTAAITSPLPTPPGKSN